MKKQATKVIPVERAELEVELRGSGEPVVLIQTALIADELRLLADQPVLRSAYRTVIYHRRGYGASSSAQGVGSVLRDAADCQALLVALGIERAHIVGLSYSAAVALQLALDAPSMVQTMVLLEPPPVHIPSADEFRAANTQLLEARRVSGSAAALDQFATVVLGHDWRVAVERKLPGAVEQMQRDATTFFDTDIPALLAWRFTGAHAGQLTCPALYVGGTASGPWFAEVRALILSWLPQVEDAIISGADHSLAITHPAEIAGALVPFLKRHPIKGG